MLRNIFVNSLIRTNVTGFRDDVRLISFWDVISLGKKTANNNLADVSAEPVPPTPGKSCPQTEAGCCN